MKSSLLEQRLSQKLSDSISGATPGVQLQIHQAGRKVCDISVGETYPYYDLASLTKIIFTVPALMYAFERGKWNFESTITDFWPEFPHSKIKLTQLLTHSSGALWRYPFYNEIDLQATEEERRKFVKDKIRLLEWTPKDESVYSDVGMMVLGTCLEQMFERSLAEIWKEIKSYVYPGLSTLDFQYSNQLTEPQKYYAPTERCPWRGRLVQGEVHDENAWALGGVSTHAGLFASIDDVSWYGLFLRSQLLGISKTSFRSKTVKAFTNRSRPLGKGDWALGFMMPTPGSSSCGDYFSPYSVGHTGFTGTSVWYDPNPDLLVVVLSNRIQLGRERQDFLALRPKIHNWVVEELRRF